MLPADSKTNRSKWIQSLLDPRLNLKGDLSANCAENVRLLEVLSRLLDSKLGSGLLVSDFDPIVHMAEIELIELCVVRTKVISTEVVTSYSA